MDKDQLPKVISIEKSIEHVRHLRNERIKSLMQTPELMNFLEEHYNIFAISPVKQEFLKRDLKELSQSPLDLAHYSALIRKLKDSDPGVKEHYLLIDQEVKALVEKYGFVK